jgi:hypothetical protein
METEYICFWYDGNDFHLTRCMIDVATGKPIGFPEETGTISLIIEFDKGHEPTFYDEAIVTETGIENTF